MTATAKIIQMFHLKIVHHFLHVTQKLMMCVRMNQTIFKLQYLCTKYSDNYSDILWKFMEV